MSHANFDTIARLFASRRNRRSATVRSRPNEQGAPSIMDANRFDTIAKLFASRRTRRAALKGSGIALAAAMAPLSGGPVRNLAAQEATPATCPITTEEENQAIVQRWYDIVDAGDVDAFPTVLAPKIVQHAADFVDARGVEEVQASFAPFFAAFPDLQHEIMEGVTDGELVAVRAVGHGTHRGEFAGITSTGREVSWNLITIFRIVCGRIAEQWSEVDAVGRLQQLGAIPPLGTVAVSTPSSDATPTAMTGTPADCPATNEQENADLVRGWYDEVWTQGNLDVLDRYLAVDHRHHRVLDRYTTGTDARAETIQGWHTTLPDLEITTEFLLTDADLVVSRWTATGTHEGPWENIAPTGNIVTWTGNTIFRIACGRIAEEWSEADGLAFFQQLGVVQWPPQATPAPQ